MDYKFDGDPINAGDRLYDWNEGVVEVRDVFSDGILVNKHTNAGRHRVIQYDFNGFAAGARVKPLFWQMPVIITPRKNATLWASQCKIIRELVTQFSLFVTSADAVPEQDPRTMSINDAMNRGLITGAEAKQIAAQLRESDATTAG